MTNFRKLARRPLPTLVVLVVAAFFTFAFSKVDRSRPTNLSLALLIQEDLQGAVASDIEAYRDFVQSLPAGTQVMVAYARTGSIRVGQTWTFDLKTAAAAIRPPSGLANLAPGSPYESLKEVLKRFPEGSSTLKKVVFVSDGFDRYATLGGSPADNPILEQAVRRAKKGDVEVTTIFARGSAAGPFRNAAIRQGQNSLSYLAERTEGEAFFSGDTYISAKPFLQEIHERLILETAELKTLGSP